MKAVVDPDDRLALPRQRPAPRRPDAANEREPPRDVAVMFELREVGLGRDDRDQHVAAFGRLAGRRQHDAVGRRVELLEVAPDLVEIRELVVVARREPEHVARRRDRRLARYHRANRECGRDNPERRCDPDRRSRVGAWQCAQAALPGHVVRIIGCTPRCIAMRLYTVLARGHA